MDALQNLAMVMIAATVFWAYLKLKDRIEFLEHELRWLRKEMEDMKPIEVRSAND